jgi:hypothetical protein
MRSINNISDKIVQNEIENIYKVLSMLEAKVNEESKKLRIAIEKYMVDELGKIRKEIDILKNKIKG